MMRFALCLFALFLVAPIVAQSTNPSSDQRPLRVYLVTFGPGDEVYEHWGHNALIIRNTSNQQQIAYHYGVFDFNQPNFLGRFVLGRMLYAMGGVPSEYVDQMVQDYVKADRDVWMQELDLSQPQIDQLLNYLGQNYLDENRNYLYEYYRANCSTKLRDALNFALNGQLQRTWGGIPTDNSYRRFTRIGAGDNFWVYTGLALVLSSNVDQMITLWDEAFVPMNLRGQLNRLSINGSPIVREERVLHVSQHLRLRSEPPQWIPLYLLIGVGVGGAMGLCGLRFRRTSWTNRGLRVMTFTWSLICGAAGLFMLSVWLFTNHVAGHANQNLLLFSPLSFVLMIVAPSKVKGKPRGRWAMPVARAVVALAIGALLLKITPVPKQYNWEMIALALPIHLGLMFAIAEPKSKMKSDVSLKPQSAASV